MEPYSEEELIAFGEFIISELELYGEIDDILKSDKECEALLSELNKK